MYQLSKKVGIKAWTYAFIKTFQRYYDTKGQTNQGLITESVTENRKTNH